MTVEGNPVGEAIAQLRGYADSDQSAGQQGAAQMQGPTAAAEGASNDGNEETVQGGYEVVAEGQQVAGEIQASASSPFAALDDGVSLSAAVPGGNMLQQHQNSITTAAAVPANSLTMQANAQPDIQPALGPQPIHLSRKVAAKLIVAMSNPVLSN